MLKSRALRSVLVSVVPALLLAFVMSCKARRVEENVGQASQQPTEPQPSAMPSQSSSQQPVLAPPATLMTLPESAYGKTLLVDADAVYLLTANAAYRLVEGKDAVRMELDLGIGPAATRDAIVFWSNGAVYRAPKKGGKPRRVTSLPHQPQQFFAAGDRFAWLDHADDGRFTLQTMKGASPKVIHTTHRQVDVITMLEEHVVFAERTEEGKWRFASVPLDAGEVVYSAEHSGRTPAELVAAEHIHYYDGNSFEIRRLARDLKSEEVLVKGSVCSPMAVARQIFCGAVDGPYRISAKRPVPQLLAEGGGRSVTALAADGTRVVWVRDEGAEKLSVQAQHVADEPSP